MGRDAAPVVRRAPEVAEIGAVIPVRFVLSILPFSRCVRRTARRRAVRPFVRKRDDEAVCSSAARAHPRRRLSCAPDAFEIVAVIPVGFVLEFCRRPDDARVDILRVAASDLRTLNSLHFRRMALFCRLSGMTGPPALWHFIVPAGGAVCQGAVGHHDGGSCGRQNRKEAARGYC